MKKISEFKMQESEMTKEEYLSVLGRITDGDYIVAQITNETGTSGMTILRDVDEFTCIHAVLQWDIKDDTVYATHSPAFTHFMGE